MSLDELVKGDMGARIGRFAHVCSATCIVDHVAPPARPERHARLSMSPHPIVRSDMHRRLCRSTQSSGATCIVDHVAPPACPERHGELSVSPYPIAWSDMHRRPCRSTRSCGATCEAEHVAPPNCMERHERLGIMETRASWSEILDSTSRLARPGSAAWIHGHVASPTIVRRTHPCDSSLYPSTFRRESCCFASVETAPVTFLLRANAFSSCSRRCNISLAENANGVRGFCTRFSLIWCDRVHSRSSAMMRSTSSDTFRLAAMRTTSFS